jgi:hypothetical protein
MGPRGSNFTIGYAVGKGDNAMKGVGGSGGVSETALILVRPSSLAINDIK